MPTEVWHVVWFCLTMVNPECARLDGQNPVTVYSEESCEAYAEGMANIWFNEKGFQVEYGCKKVRTLTPYVARRRF